MILYALDCTEIFLLLNVFVGGTPAENEEFSGQGEGDGLAQEPHGLGRDGKQGRGGRPQGFGRLVLFQAIKVKFSYIHDFSVSIFIIN